jgi:hypothetical protein
MTVKTPSPNPIFDERTARIFYLTKKFIRVAHKQNFHAYWYCRSQGDAAENRHWNAAWRAHETTICIVEELNELCIGKEPIPLPKWTMEKQINRYYDLLDKCDIRDRDAVPQLKDFA